MQELTRCAKDAAAAAPAMAQEAFSDYHLYTLGRKTTINNSETKQVSMLGATGVPRPEALRRRRPGVLLPQRAASGRADQGRRAGVSTSSRTKRRPGSACRCRPAPCASTSPTRRAACSSSARTGSTTRRRTRRSISRSATRSTSSCERKQTDFQKIASNVYEVEYEITLRNHKATPVTVEVNEPIGGTWRMLQSSHEWTKTVGVGGAVHGAGRRGRHRGAEIQSAGDVLRACLAGRVRHGRQGGRERQEGLR